MKKKIQILILCLLAFSFMCSQLFSQGEKYSLVFINSSSNTGSVCVYQKDPGIGVANIYSLAWFAKRATPTTRIYFQWTIGYSFVWSETGELKPGIMFHASQVWPANLSTTNEVDFNFKAGAYDFENQRPGPKPGHLYINELSAVPLKQASVGIGMSGAGTFVTQAQPNWLLTFTPHPQYWIAFGDYFEGEVLDINQMTLPHIVQFPPGVFSMTAILNPDNTWTIKPTSEVNADFVKAKKRNKKARWGKY